MRLLAAIAVLAVPVLAADAPKPKKDSFKSDDERAIYTIGFLMGRNVTSFNLSAAETKVLQSGLSDAAQGKEAQVDLRFHQSRINEMLQKRMGAASEKEKEKGKKWTEEYVKKETPTAIEGGGWYKELTAGTGDNPKPTDTVKVHYRGTLTDGTEFDSSYKRGEPASFPLNQVIPCWTRGVAMMKPGGKAKLVCPSDVAYGDQGSPPAIKGGSTLVFEVELLEITKAEQPKAEEKKGKKKS